MRRRPEARGASSSTMSNLKAGNATISLPRNAIPEEESRMSVKVSMKVNGKPVSAEVEARTLVGCDTAQCGACTVHMNGKAIKSCSIVAMQAEGADILTIEGVAHADG